MGLCIHKAASAWSHGTTCPGDTASHHLSPHFPHHQLLYASAWPQDHWRRCCASQTPTWGGCQGRRAVPDDGGAGSRRGLPTPLRGTGPVLAALIRAQRCREGPDTPCWRRAEPSVCSVRGCQLPVRILCAGPASAGPCCWHGQLGGCFCRRSGEGMPCLVRAGAADG